MLLEQYVAAVNEKNELVHDLDSQERLIGEDERIRSFIANRDVLVQPDGSQARHNLMEDFLNFLKK